MSAAPVVSHILFWDVDGTLLTTARAGVFALEEAAREVLGRDVEFANLATAGLTDSEVAALAIGAAGSEATDEVVNAFLRAYERHLPDRLHWREGRPLEGVKEILTDLEGRPEVASFLLTGNTPAGARAKLLHYGLWDFFAGGAFCSGVQTREEIAAVAWKLAAEHLGTDPDPERVYVIGDTPHDVRAGKAIGARTVAVASGPHPIDDLVACDPWLVLPALPPPGEFAAALELLPVGAPEG